MESPKKSDQDPEPRSSISPPKSPGPQKCNFCHEDTDDSVLYGEMKRAHNIVAHYYCILMSTDLLQRGRDLDGIDGFLISDIQNILNATKNVKCTYCHKPNATARCNAPDCYKIFHYPCGLRNHALSEFCNSFHSYCDVHNLNRGRNLRRYIALSNIPPNCIYCHEVIRAEHDYYVTECCRVCVMHTRCLKQHALSFGYFTRCPNCNSRSNFMRSIRNNGIFIPFADNVWDLDNEATRGFEVTLQCEVPNCKCPHNRRDHNARSGRCRLCICRICGGNAAHYKCKGTVGYTYVCSVCRPVIARERALRTQRHAEARANLDAQVVLVPLSLADLRARGITIPCTYNLRSRSNRR